VSPAYPVLVNSVSNADRASLEFSFTVKFKINFTATSQTATYNTVSTTYFSEYKRTLCPNTK